MAATNLLIDLTNKKAVKALSDPNPIVPPDISSPGNYDFNAYYLDYGSPYTYHRFSTATNELNLRINGPPTDGTFTVTFEGYTSVPININTSLSDFQDALNGVRSIGKGNSQVDGSKTAGWTIEFIGNRAGLAQQMMTVNTTGTLELSESIVDPIQTGAINGQNAKQRIKVIQKAVKTTRNFLELTASSQWGWTTVGGMALSTSGIPPSFWQNPVYDIILDLKLFVNGSRTGNDGITSTVSARSGTDGVVSDDGTARSGTDGVVSQTTRAFSGNLYDRGYSGIWPSYAGSFSGVPRNQTIDAPAGTFSSADIGAVVSGTYIPTGCTIVDVNTGGTVPGGIARINMQTANIPGHTVNEALLLTYNQSNVLQSASAAFTAADLHHVIDITGFPSGTTILSVGPTSVIVSNYGPTGSGLSWTIEPQQGLGYSSASANFTAADRGRGISGGNLSPGTTIASVVDSSHIILSQPGTAIGTGLSWTIAAGISTTYQSATAHFVSGDVGKIITGDNIPPNTTIFSFTDISHVVLSNAPTAAGTALNWQIVEVSSAAPTVTDIQVGTSTSPAIQRVTFAQVPAFGTFTLQDSAGGSQPLALIQAPLDAAAVQAALNISYPALSPFTVKQISSSIIEITWGVNGSRGHILVNDTNLVYDHQALALVLVAGVGDTGGNPISGLPNIIDGNIAYFGDVRSAHPCGEVLYDTLSDGTGAVRYRQRFAILKRFFSPQALNTAGPNGSYLIGEENMEDRNGILIWDRVWVTLPANRLERHQQQRACIGTAKTFNGSTLVDQQLFSVSISTWVNVYFTYYLGHPGQSHIPADGPAGVIIHFTNGSSVLVPFNGFDINFGTFANQFTQNWSRRRWMGNIWEQAEFVN